jgi:hypothetical protein
VIGHWRLIGHAALSDHTYWSNFLIALWSRMAEAGA